MNSLAGRLGGTVAGSSYTGVAPGGGYRGGGHSGGRQRTVVVPYAYPVFYDGGAGYYPPDNNSRPMSRLWFHSNLYRK